MQKPTILIENEPKGSRLVERTLWSAPTCRSFPFSINCGTKGYFNCLALKQPESGDKSPHSKDAHLGVLRLVGAFSFFPILAQHYHTQLQVITKEKRYQATAIQKVFK